MSVTQAEVDALDLMIGSGVLSTSYDGKRIEYRTMDELLAARAFKAAQLAKQSGSAPASYSNPVFSRGL